MMQAVVEPILWDIDLAIAIQSLDLQAFQLIEYDTFDGTIPFTNEQINQAAAAIFDRPCFPDNPLARVFVPVDESECSLALHCFVIEQYLNNINHILEVTNCGTLQIDDFFGAPSHDSNARAITAITMNAEMYGIFFGLIASDEVCVRPEHLLQKAGDGQEDSSVVDKLFQLACKNVLANSGESLGRGRMLETRFLSRGMLDVSDRRFVTQLYDAVHNAQLSDGDFFFEGDVQERIAQHVREKFIAALKGALTGRSYTVDSDGLIRLGFGN